MSGSIEVDSGGVGWGTGEHKAVGELAARVIRLVECAGATPEIKRLVARGVLTQATRVALLLGVDLDTAGPTMDLAAATPGRDEPPVVSIGPGGDFMNNWPRGRR